MLMCSLLNQFRARNFCIFVIIFCFKHILIFLRYFFLSFDIKICFTLHKTFWLFFVAFCWAKLICWLSHFIFKEKLVDFCNNIWYCHSYEKFTCKFRLSRLSTFTIPLNLVIKNCIEQLENAVKNLKKP